jgi:hypothetical protein
MFVASLSSNDTSNLHKFTNRQTDKQRLLIPHDMCSLIQPILRYALRQLEIKVPEKVGDDQTHLMVSKTGNSQVSLCCSAVLHSEWGLLHSKTVPRSSGERLKGSLLVARKSCIEAFSIFCEPALGKEALGIHEVV